MCLICLYVCRWNVTHDIWWLTERCLWGGDIVSMWQNQKTHPVFSPSPMRKRGIRPLLWYLMLNIFVSSSLSGHLGGSLHSVRAAGPGLRPPGGPRVRHLDSHLQNTEVLIIGSCLSLVSVRLFYCHHNIHHTHWTNLLPHIIACKYIRMKRFGSCKQKNLVFLTFPLVL